MFSPNPAASRGIPLIACLALAAAGFSGCAHHFAQNSSLIHAENAIVARLAEVRPGQQLAGLLRDLEIDEFALLASVWGGQGTPIFGSPPDPESQARVDRTILMRLNERQKWIDFRITLDSPLSAREFVRVTLSLPPHPDSKLAPPPSPGIKSVEILYFDPDYRGFVFPANYTIRKVTTAPDDWLLPPGQVPPGMEDWLFTKGARFYRNAPAGTVPPPPPAWEFVRLRSPVCRPPEARWPEP